VQKIREVLSSCEFYDCECERDVGLAREFGFRGEVLPVLPNAGGYDLQALRAMRQPGPASERKLILLKGYQGWQGRALFALRGLELAADALKGYRLAIFRAMTEDVLISARLLAARTGLPVEFIPPVPQDEMFRLQGRARMYVAMNISDGIGISILEAMMMGAFPIHSNTGSAEEWVKHGQSGFIVDPEDPGQIAEAVRRAATDDELVDRAAAINAKTADERLAESVIRPKVIESYQRIAR
jgi:glycosyltransferase involved in cell wall biosynthesis